MDFLQLPLLKPTDTILEAMDRMQTADARAIVVGPLGPVGGDYQLQMNTAVMKGYKGNLQFLYQLESGTPLPDLSNHLAFRGLGGGSYSPGSQDSIERTLDSQNTSYALSSSVGGGTPVATIVTRHEGYAAQIRDANKVCVCDGPGRHPGDAPPLHDGDGCEICSHTYICR